MKTESKTHFITFDPDELDGASCKVIAYTSPSFPLLIVYVPGRTVYVDSINGSQYKPGLYYVLQETETKNVYTEVVTFGRGV